MLESVGSAAVIVRQATSADVDMMVAVINAAFVVEAPIIRGPRTDAADVSARLASGEFLLLEEEGAPIGCVYLEHAGPRAFFGMLAVDPGRQQGGLGRRLVEAAEARARAYGCTFMEIKIVSVREELFPYYRRLGYAETGETARFSPEAEKLLRTPCHFVTMRKEL